MFDVCRFTFHDTYSALLLHSVFYILYSALFTFDLFFISLMPETGRILVVDDLPLNIEFLEESLTAHGFEVFSASDGEEALKRIVEVEPDLLLLDLSMPKLDGIGVLKVIRGDEEFRDLPVILLTARREQENKVEGLDAGADDYITKPFYIDEVIARIRSLLRMRHIQAEIVEKEKHLAQVETLQQALGTLSHHINNANQAILCAAQLSELARDDPRRATNLISVCLHQTARAKAVLGCLDKMVEHMAFKTTDYAGDAGRILDIEEELKQRLENLDKGKESGDGDDRDS